MDPSASPTPSGHRMLRALTDDTFADVLASTPGVMLVDFGAEWCAPCRMMTPILLRLAEQYAGRATVATVDVDSCPRVAVAYQARSLPTFQFFVNGVPKDRVVGAVPAARLISVMEALLAAQS